MKIAILKEVSENVIHVLEVVTTVDEVKTKPLKVQIKTNLKLIGVCKGQSLNDLVQKILEKAQ